MVDKIWRKSNFMTEIWADGKKISDWAQRTMPQVGEAITITIKDNIEKFAEVIKVTETWDRAGSKKTVINVLLTGQMHFN